MTIELYSTDARLIKLMKDASTGLTKLNVHKPRWRELPRQFDYVATTSQLSSGIERFAAGYGAIVIVMPEAGFWLADRARKFLSPLTVLGTDYREARA